MGGLSLVSSLSGIIPCSNSTHGKIDIIFADYDPETKEANILSLKDIPYSVKIREKGEGYFELTFELKSPLSRRSYVVRTLFKSDEAYHHYDALGSVVALTDEKGKVAAEYDYSPFGRIIDWQGGESLRNHFTFTGREYDRDSGLYFYRARYYDSRVGRFGQVDPLLRQASRLVSQGFEARLASSASEICPTCGGRTSGFSFPVSAPAFSPSGAPIFEHAYVYAGNNPIRYTDPTGQRRSWASYEKHAGKNCCPGTNSDDRKQCEERIKEIDYILSYMDSHNGELPTKTQKGQQFKRGATTFCAAGNIPITNVSLSDEQLKSCLGGCMPAHENVHRKLCEEDYTKFNEGLYAIDQRPYEGPAYEAERRCYEGLLSGR